MSRYTKAKTKLSRRVNRNLFLKGARSFSAKDDYTKNPFKQSSAGRRRRPTSSEYSKQLTEKQALRFYYGLSEKQLSNVFKKSFKQTGDTAQQALTKLEMRLDNVIYRGGLANSRAQARQLVSHGQFEVNGVKTNIPSFLVKPGDMINVKANKQKSNFWSVYELQIPAGTPSWLDSTKKLTVKVLSMPIPEDLPDDMNMAYIVEYYSRKVA